MRALQARGTGIETRILHIFGVTGIALVAQMVERKTLNLVVVGSIPTEGVFLKLVGAVGLECLRGCFSHH